MSLRCNSIFCHLIDSIHLVFQVLSFFFVFIYYFFRFLFFIFYYFQFCPQHNTTQHNTKQTSDQMILLQKDKAIYAQTTNLVVLHHAIFSFIRAIQHECSQFVLLKRFLFRRLVRSSP